MPVLKASLEWRVKRVMKLINVRLLLFVSQFLSPAVFTSGHLNSANEKSSPTAIWSERWYSPIIKRLQKERLFEKVSISLKLIKRAAKNSQFSNFWHCACLHFYSHKLTCTWLPRHFCWLQAFSLLLAFTVTKISPEMGTIELPTTLSGVQFMETGDFALKSMLRHLELCC